MTNGMNYAILSLCSIVNIVMAGRTPASGMVLLPPDPNNAALLYYQAFLIRPEADATALKSLGALMDGARPDSQVRMYLKVCKECLEVVTAASELPYCHWGMRYSRGFGYQAPYLLEVQRTAHLLRAEALVLAADGNYRRAFDACLVMRRMARHVGDDTSLTYQCSIGEDLKSLRTIGYILGLMPRSTEDLVWLKNRLYTPPRSSISLDRALKMDLDLALQSLGTDDAVRTETTRRLVESAGDDQTKARLEKLTDEELLRRASLPYVRYLTDALRVINENTAYTNAYPELQRLTKKLELEYAQDPAVNQLIRACAKSVIGGYDTKLIHSATLNALIDALDIYLANAETGRLPKTRSETQARDPYTGRDFEYVVTEKGFILRCRAADVRLGKPREFEFSVRAD